MGPFPEEGVPVGGVNPGGGLEMRGWGLAPYDAAYLAALAYGAG